MKWSNIMVDVMTQGRGMRPPPCRVMRDMTQECRYSLEVTQGKRAYIEKIGLLTLC